MRVLLHDNSLTVRGTTQAMRDYARILAAAGHVPVISWNLRAENNSREVQLSVEREFETLPYETSGQLVESSQRFDLGYFIKSGRRDGLYFRDRPSLVHAVFQTFDPHGSRYLYVSDWLASRMHSRFRRSPRLRLRAHRATRRGCRAASAFAALSHVVDLSQPTVGDPLQDIVPSDAQVALRYGGWDSFDVPWVKSMLLDYADSNRDFHFVGVNTEPFVAHPRFHFLRPVYSSAEKAALLARADLFLHARKGGESFGIALVEALQSGIPILAWSGGHDRNHVKLLDRFDFLYSDYKDLMRRLKAWGAGEISQARTDRAPEYRAASMSAIVLGTFEAVACESAL